VVAGISAESPERDRQMIAFRARCLVSNKGVVGKRGIFELNANSKW